MGKPRFVEFRDLDGSYVLVRPLDEVRGRVVSSNRAARGRVLYKDGALSWERAAEDLGGYTRLSPEELLGEERDGRRPGEWADREPEPEAMLLRLAIHYRTRHRRRVEGRTVYEICRCETYAPGEDAALAWFHALTFWGLRDRRVPTLGRIVRALARAARAV